MSLLRKIKWNPKIFIILLVLLVLQHNGKLMPVCNDRNNPAENKVHHFLWVKLKLLVEVTLFEQSGAVIA